MNFNLKKAGGGIILFLGLLLFFTSLGNNNLNLSLVYLTSTLIFWVLYSILLDVFDIRIFAWVISSAGFLLAISIFFLYGVEEVPHPVGAIVFHSGGIAGALGISLFSLFPLLILHQLSPEKEVSTETLTQAAEEQVAEPELFSDEWELATEEELQSGEFETG
ncbi:MAG: hypothetical protein QGF36_01390 [Candidatus Marinimicrobia bacterium]|nr:hypothetical protein [Candidatus Neomarinimicrobiota bacterium]MDP6936063.1 hypothetical protein [Candidatus Neomarinimicrobiota bacterium]